jgi:hypothetical protein
VSALLFAAAVLGTYRVARLVTQEDGPFDAFAGLRARAGQGSWVGRGLHCALCASFWLALLAALLLLPWADWRELVLLWGGVAGGAVVVYKVVG